VSDICCRRWFTLLIPELPIGDCRFGAFLQVYCRRRAAHSLRALWDSGQLRTCFPDQSSKYFGAPGQVCPAALGRFVIGILKKEKKD
jgi:hypothetical protein